MAIAAPWPVFRSLNKAAFNRITVDIAQLLCELGIGEHVEVVVAGMPVPRPVTSELFGCLRLEGAKDAVQLDQLRFIDEQMNVLRHENVAEDVEPMSLSKTFEVFKKDGTAVIIVEIRKTLVATEGDEMIVAEVVKSLQMNRHSGIIPNPVPAK